jgi:hypothetical protein
MFQTERTVDRAAFSERGDRATPSNGSTLGGTHLRFLATKIVPPRCQGLIERPRLLALTSQLSEKRLAVVKAPAGFGKTLWPRLGCNGLNRAKMLSHG